MPLPPDFEKRLWDAANQLWTNSTLKPSDYSMPVLALIFLRYADHRFAAVEKQLTSGRRRGAVGKEDYHAAGVIFVPPAARFSKLLQLPEGTDIGKALNEAMKAVEAENDEVKGVLPRTYGGFQTATLKEMLKLFSTIPEDVEGDVFGPIYEYFLGAFAPHTLQKGGEFYTPYSVVRLIVEVLEPYHGTIYDPACGSGGMFVQSASFIAEHKQTPTDEISIYGVEKVAETYKLAKMNLAVHGLASDIKSELNSYYDDPHDAAGRFDFVMANPPFNQKPVDHERIKDDTKRYPFGMPTRDNANYLWIQLFYSSLKKDKGRAGFVMANSAADARGAELEIRKKLIETGAVDVIASLTTNLFYTVTLPVTLWFFDKGKAKADRKDTVLFIDARHYFRQVDRAHREMTHEQVEFIANIVRLYRGRVTERQRGSAALMEQHFPDGKYVDVLGLCRVVRRKDIEAQGHSLNAGRYIGVAERAPDDFDFKERLEQLSEQLEALNAEARILEGTIGTTLADLLEAE